MNASTALTATVVLCCASLISAAENSNDSASQPAIATYEGQVFNGDDMDPLLTTFTVDGKSISGTYVIEEESGFETGNLNSCKFEGEYTVTCLWTDKYGSGFARILFAADYRAFNGFWGQTPETAVFPWNGIRKDVSEQ